jgi:WD40 repeat protein/3',5'-cyclic AMP phosphodiesterase CpdA
MPNRDPITLLHVSDMQFGRNHRFRKAGLTAADRSFDTLSQRLIPDLGVLEKEGVHPDVIVVSGDLAEWGLKDEFEEALGFLAALSESLKVPRRRVIVVPGNHDINRKLCESYFAECEGDGEKPAPPYSRKWKHYAWMFQQFYGGEKGVSFSLEDTQWSFWELEELQVAVAGLNSTMAETHEDGTHYGWVGEAQLDWFARRLAPYGEKGWLRIGVVHHNVLRGAVDDDENLRDANDLERILAPSLDLLLHGHTHNAKMGRLGYELPVLSTGSAALTAKVLPAEAPNQYQAIRVWPDRLERWTRRYDAEQKRWVGDTRCSDDGGNWRTKYPLRQQRVSPTPEPAARAETARDDFASRVAEVARLRHTNAEVEIRTGAEATYLKVLHKDGAVVRSFPIGLSEYGISEAQFQQFREQVLAPHRALDPALTCELVYGGDRADDELIRAAAGAGVRLSSFVEFQGIIDFRGYVERQTRKLSNDLIYPPHLYVPQRFEYEIGRNRQESRDAYGTIVEWLKEPFARFVLVLGDFGTGKTFLLHELARRMPQSIPHLVPVLVELRALEKARTLEQLVAQHLAASEERYIDLAAFPYMLKQGRIALLFDGFDELAQRVTYNRATEHFETLLQAAGGNAKVVVTSRTQHFESDQQVKTALLERTETLPGLHIARLRQFDEEQIRQFLRNMLGQSDAAERRFELIHDIKDLLGLSHNPRMLSFIARLPEEQLREAQAKTGTITAAALYRLLIDRWLTFEYERMQPRGSAPTLTIEERRRAVTAVALCLWGKLERTLSLSELAEEVARAVDTLAERQMDAQTATHLVGSGTLLVRDEAGLFAFVHQSVMEWLVASRAAEELQASGGSAALGVRAMSALMTDFLCDLAGAERAREWAEAAVSGAEAERQFAKTNALLVLERLGVEAPALASFGGEDLRGRDFSKRDLRDLSFARADLTEARFEAANLKRASFANATLERADFTRAVLVEADLFAAKAAGARFAGADLRDATLKEANFRRAKLVGAQLPSPLEGDFFGAALPGDAPQPMISWPSAARAVCFGPDGLVASGHDDGGIRIWDAGTGQEIRSLRGHESLVYSVDFRFDGRILASAGSDETVRLWDVSAGRVLRLLEGHMFTVRSVAFRPDGRQVASAGSDQTLLLWDAETGKELLSFPAHNGYASAVAFSPNGQWLASGGADNIVLIWDSATGKQVRALRGHQDFVYSVAFSPDGLHLASGSGDNTVRLWEVETGQPLRIFRGHRQYVRSVGFSPDGLRVASAGNDETVRVWDCANGQELRCLSGHQHPAYGVAFSPGGDFLASASLDETIRFWDLTTGQPTRTLTAHKAMVRAIAFSPKGRRFASADESRVIRLWDFRKGKQTAVLKGHQAAIHSVAFSPDGRMLASGGDDQSIHLWNPVNGDRLRTLRKDQSYVYGLAFSPDGRLLASCGFDKLVRLWDPFEGQQVSVISGHAAGVHSIEFGPDSSILASASADKTVRLWEIATGQQLKIFSGHEAGVVSLSFSPDGLTLASAGEDKTIRIWDVLSGKPKRVLTGHESLVGRIAFSPRGELLASASRDNTVRVWHTANGRLMHVFTDHATTVSSVAFTADGKRLASGGADNSVRFRDIESGALLATFVLAPEGWAAFTPDGRYKVGGDIAGAFWYAINLCRFEPRELDAFLAGGTLRQLPLDEPLW